MDETAENKVLDNKQEEEGVVEASAITEAESLEGELQSEAPPSREKSLELVPKSAESDNAPKHRSSVRSKTEESSSYCSQSQFGSFKNSFDESYDGIQVAQYEGEEEYYEEPFREEKLSVEEEEICVSDRVADEEELRAGESEGSTPSADSLSTVYKKLSPFGIKWSFGMKTSIQLINLTTSNRFEVFCVASHFGVIYNYRKNTMIFLPGHNFPIRSIASDITGRWLVSADSGEDTVIIIWDNTKKIPAWALYNVFPEEGTKCVAISQDARYLAAINCNFNFVLKFWLWTLGQVEPDGTVEINPAFGKAKHIAFNHLNTNQFAITTELQIIFCEWVHELKTIETFAPEFEHPQKKLGLFRESVFLDDNNTVLTSTNSGRVVVWYKCKEPEGSEGTIKKNYLKTVKIHQSGITSLRLCDKVLISSSEDGTIFFHDQFLRLLYWLPKVQLDPLVSISFNRTPFALDQLDPFSPGFNEATKQSASTEEIGNAFDYDDSTSADSDTKDKVSTVEKKKEVLEEDIGIRNSFASKEAIHLPHQQSISLKNPKRMPSDCTQEMRPFIMRDFMFLTKTGKIGYLSHFWKKIKYYLYETDSCVLSLDCHPSRSHLVVGNASGQLSFYEYITKRLLMSIFVSKEGITTLKYSRKGQILMVGLQSGTLIEFDPLLFKELSQLDFAKAPIKKLCFSPNDELLAYYDEKSTVYVYLKRQNMHNWHFKGRYISHYKPIRDILFEETFDNPRLFTIGEDRMMVEYDMENLRDSDLKILNRVRIEQTAIPHCFTWYPKYYNNREFLICNSEYKLKVVDAKDHVCRKTTLGPTADTPINFVKIVPKWKSNEKTWKMIYATKKHIGIRLLPPTGNPFEGMGMVAHPDKIVALAMSHDSKYIFTAGLNDTSVLKWAANPTSVDIAFQLGGVGLEPFMSLIEGGPNSFLFKEIEDFFYYAQIIHQGEDPNLDRSVAKTLALCEIPDLFRALGYYPTDYEVNNLLHELKYMTYYEDKKFTEELTFEDCVKAFLNHKPVRGISLKQINTALMAIADLTDPNDIIVEKTELYKALEEVGEPMEHAEVVGYLCILLLPKDENNPVPPSLSLAEFAEIVLGIDLTITEETVRHITHAFETKNTIKNGKNLKISGFGQRLGISPLTETHFGKKTYVDYDVNS